MSQQGTGTIRRPRSTPRRAFEAWILGLTLLIGASSSGFAGEVEFNRDIRPILRETCFRCHGPDSASRKADLRLDQREDAIKAGAIVPGKLDESELIARILSDDPEEVMPPAGLAQDARRRPEGAAQEVGRLGGRVPAALGVHRPEQGRAARTSRTRPGPGTRSTASSWRRWPRRASSPRPRPTAGPSPAASASTSPACRPTPADVEAFVADDAARRLREVRRPAPRLARLGRAPGPLLARRRPLCRHPRHPHRQLPRDLGRTATGSSRRSTPISRSTSSPSSSWPATSCPTGRSTSRSPRASTAATSRPAKAGRSTRNTWSSTPATGPRRSRRSSSA